MFIFLLILIIIIFILLLITASIVPVHSEFSMFELEHRAEIGDRLAKKALSREKLLADVASLLHMVTVLLLVILVLLNILAFSWLYGVLATLFVVFCYGTVAHLKIVNKLSQKIYDRVEKRILHFIRKSPILFKLFRNTQTPNDLKNQRIASRAELQHLIAESESVLTVDEKDLIVGGLSFGDQLVNTVMTPSDKIVSIKRTEFLGPLMLDDLHKVGHSRLPVINGDINHIIGILNLQGLLALDVKRSTTAEKAMEQRVFYIREDQTLLQALAGFLQTHYNLFIVVDKSRETVGILTLGDVIKTLFGREIIDEFDAYDNLRSVVSRNKG